MSQHRRIRLAVMLTLVALVTVSQSTRSDAAERRADAVVPVTCETWESGGAPSTDAIQSKVANLERTLDAICSEQRADVALATKDNASRSTSASRAVLGAALCAGVNSASEGLRAWSSVAFEKASILARSTRAGLDRQIAVVNSQREAAQRAAAGRTPVVERRLARLATQLDAVAGTHATMDEVSSPVLDVRAISPVALAAVTDAASSDASKAEPQAPTPAPEKPAATEPAPAPPEKRETEKAGVTDAATTSRMQKLLMGLANLQQNPAAVGLTTHAEAEAPPAKPAAAPEEKTSSKPAKPSAPEEPVYVGDPMDQLVSIDFRDMELSNVVALLAQKAQINVIAGADLAGVVTANLKNVTLRRAMETVLRMNNLGLLEEEGIYHIVPYEEAVAAKRVTAMVKLENGNADDVKKTLDALVKGSPEDALMSISVNSNTNMIVLAGPEARVEHFRQLVKDLDISKPVPPTVTEPMKINNAEPKDLIPLVTGMLTPQIGKVNMDERGRHLVVTDVPVVLEQVRELVKAIDLPVKQVSIDTMVVDAVMADDAQTGVDWILSAVPHLNRRGQVIGSLQNLSNEVDSTGVEVTPGEIKPMQLVNSIAFGVLTNNIDLRATIAGEVYKQKAKLLANPVVVTVENKPANINITQEIPYQEQTQSTTGPPMSTTSFKEIGIILDVVPRVTHDDHVISDVNVKQSDTKGELNNIPIEDKRETKTTLRTRNGQTVFIGGLRRFDDELQARKVPVLGDIPVMNLMFRNNVVKKESTELLVFLTCNVLPDEMEEMPAELQAAHEELDTIPKTQNAGKALWRETVHPNAVEDPAWKWRRSR